MTVLRIFGNSRRQGMAFVLPVSRTTRFLSHRKVVYRDGVLETPFILPAHTDPIRFTADPGSDTIARG